MVDGLLDQVVPALKMGAIVIDHSTTLPETTGARVERMRAHGIRFLHAPVFMSPQMAADGMGLILVSGPAQDFEAVRAELEKMTGEVWYLGERPDLAAAYKLFGNCMLFAISAGLADVIAMARANAIDPLEGVEHLLEVPGGQHHQRPRTAHGARRGDARRASGVAMARKDVGLMIDRRQGGAARRAARRRDADGRSHRGRRRRAGSRRPRHLAYPRGFAPRTRAMDRLTATSP